MKWQLANRASTDAVRLADRHYNRQKPGTPQFVPPGRCLVFTTSDGLAVWTTSWPLAEYVKHRWAGAWVNSIFRNEGPHLSSGLIREAVAATLWHWPNVPELGMITFVDADRVRPKPTPGWCFLKAGFHPAGKTKGGLLAFQMFPSDMPDADAPIGSQAILL